MFAQDCPATRRVVLLDSTPVECGRSVRDRAGARRWRRPARYALQPQPLALVLGHAAAPVCAAPDGTPRAAILASADQKERDVALRLFAVGLHGGELVVCDKGYAGRDFETPSPSASARAILRPAARTSPARGPHLSGIRQRIESIFWTLKDRLGLERHRARSLHGLRARIATKLLALAAGVWLNHYLGRPTRAFAAPRRLTDAESII